MAQNPPTAVHHRRSREIHIAVSHAHGVAELRQPAAAPHPASENRVKNRAYKQLAQDE